MVGISIDKVLSCHMMLIDIDRFLLQPLVFCHMAWHIITQKHKIKQRIKIKRIISSELIYLLTLLLGNQ